MKKNTLSLIVAILAFFTMSASSLAVSEDVKTGGQGTFDYSTFEDEEGCSSVLAMNIDDLSESSEISFKSGASDFLEMENYFETLDISTFENEEGCSSAFALSKEDLDTCEFKTLYPSKTREVTLPELFWNIARSGIYSGEWEDLRGTMYTRYYFDTINNTYHTRVRCKSEHPLINFKCGNFCITCNKALSLSDEYRTSDEANTFTSWIPLVHTVSDQHTDHFMCPFVVNTGDKLDTLYDINGEIKVNYYNKW